MKLSGGVILLFMGIYATPIWAATLYVDKASPLPAAPYSTWDTAAHGIQTAVNRAVAGDTVIVGGGGGTLVYNGYNADPGGGYNVVVLTKNISVVGVGNPIIDGLGQARGVYMTAGTLRGFTIRNGLQYRCSGAYIGGGKLYNSIVVSNGLAASGFNCGIQLGGAGAALNCLVTRNSTGVLFEGGSLVNCTVAGNFSRGLYMHQFAHVYNCISWSNGSDNWYVTPGMANTVSHFFYNCTYPTYSGPGEANGNITSNPNFPNPAAMNYRLGNGTSCLNGGSPATTLEYGTTDLDGNPRVVGNKVDIGAYEVQPPPLPDADAYEPDNSVSAAKTIASGQPQSRSIHVAGDADWAKFVVPTAGAANVRVETAGTDGDTVLAVIKGSNGAQVGYDDDSGDGSFSLVTIASLTAGTYFTKVRDYFEAATLPAYTLTASWTAGGGVPAGGDAYEPDNVSGSAKPIANGQTQSRSIHAAGNVDWAKFTVGGAGGRNVRVETAGASGDTQMWVFRSNSTGTGYGSQVAYDDDSGTGSFSLVTAATVPAGTYYVKINEYGNDGTIPAYTLRTTWTP